MAERLTLLGIPLDANSSHLRGCAAGPNAIRAALHSDAGNRSNEAGFEVVDLLDDAGDVGLLNETGSIADADAITAAVAARSDRGERVISLGGDHSVTYPILRAHAGRHPSLTVVQVDAHPDLYDDLDGNPLSHASPFARALEAGCMDQLIQFGIRTANPHQRDQARRWDVVMVAPRELSGFDLATVTGPVYLTIDLDGIDPSETPGVSHVEPGGLTVREVLGILDGLRGPVVGADVTELNPSQDPSGRTAVVAAKLVKELAEVMLRNPPA